VLWESKKKKRTVPKAIKIPEPGETISINTGVLDQLVLGTGPSRQALP